MLFTRKIVYSLINIPEKIMYIFHVYERTWTALAVSVIAFLNQSIKIKTNFSLNIYSEIHFKSPNRRVGVENIWIKNL